MNKIIIFIATLLLIGGCYYYELDNAFNKELSEFVQTRVTEPLEDTMWEFDMAGDYDKFLYFKDGEAKLFYGFTEDNIIRRSSIYYEAPYTLENGALTTNITYPQWGETKNTESISLIKSASAFTINVEGDIYQFTQKERSIKLLSFDMTLFANPAPWK